MSGTKAQQLMGTEIVRKMLSIAQNPPIQDVIEADGLLAKFVEFLSRDDQPALQFEAAWVLINVASGTSAQTMAVVKADALPLLVKLVDSPNSDLQEQAVWALGNIAGDSSKLRDMVLRNGVVDPIIRFSYF